MNPLVVNINDSKFDVKVMRPSKWGNPFPVSKTTTRDDACKFFRYHIIRSDVRRDLHELTGKVLGCCCYPKRPCHAEVLAEMSNNPFTLRAYCS